MKLPHQVEVDSSASVEARSVPLALAGSPVAPFGETPRPHWLANPGGL